MEQILLNIITGNSPLITPLVGLLAIITAGFFYIRKIDIEARTSTSSIELKRIESLMSQINQLNNELSETREELMKMHEQNMKLMLELRESNARISELEIMLRSMTATQQIPPL